MTTTATKIKFGYGLVQSELLNLFSLLKLIRFISTDYDWLDNIYIVNDSLYESASEIQNNIISGFCTGLQRLNLPDDFIVCTEEAMREIFDDFYSDGDDDFEIGVIGRLEDYFRPADLTDAQRKEMDSIFQSLRNECRNYNFHVRR